MNKKLAGFILILVVLLSYQFAFAIEPIPNAGPENYCKDPDSWTECDAIVAKYPNDWDVQTLHALRVELCVKIKQGSITLRDAIDLFDRAHNTMLQKKLPNKMKPTKTFKPKQFAPTIPLCYLVFCCVGD